MGFRNAFAVSTRSAGAWTSSATTSPTPTTGSKPSRAEFADVFAVSRTAAANAVGIGVTVAASPSSSRRATSTTDNTLDLAINGNGFFVLSDGGTMVYTRNGPFKVDRDGFIVNSQSSG